MFDVRLIVIILMMFRTLNSFSLKASKICSRSRTLSHLTAIPEGLDENTFVSTPKDVKDIDKYFMKLAIRHAQFAFREQEVPIGAVIVDASGTVIATARNRVETTKDCTMHAEIEAVRKASKLRNNWRLGGCSIYSTLEPCAMCLSCIQAARVDRIIFAAKDVRLGACGSMVDLVNTTKHPFHNVEVTGGVLADESSILLKRFFQNRRRESNELDQDMATNRSYDYLTDIDVK